MKKKNIILFILLFILILGIITILFIFKNSKEHVFDKTLESSNSNIQNSSNFSNTLENIVAEVTNNTIENNIIKNDIVENNIVENTVANNSITEVITTTTAEGNTKPNIENNTPTKTPSTTPPSTATSTTKPNDTKEETKIDTKVDIEETSKNQTVTNKEQNNTSTEKSEDPIEKEDTTPVGNPELAYSTYRVTNTDIVPEIINILNNEISKADDLVAYGSKAVAGNKSSAYSKTSGFTYLFVDDIQKGKVPGNYITFEQRVRNNVGAFGNYNVYAEDEYTYDGRGLNPKWSQTLVWIYITF